MYTIKNLIDDIKKLSQYPGLSDWAEDGVLSSSSSSAPYGERDDLIDLLTVVEAELWDILLDYGSVVNEQARATLAKQNILIHHHGQGEFSLEFENYRIEF